MNEKLPKSGSSLISCDEIRADLPAYMLRELGEKQSVLMHEHLRLCPACRQEAARFERMQALLQEHQVQAPVNAMVLSEKHLARIRFAALHPVFDWIYYRHRLVSTGCAIVLLLLVLFLLRNFALFRPPPPEETIPIWRMFRSGRLPTLVEEVAREHAGVPGNDGADTPGAGSP